MVYKMSVEDEPSGGLRGQLLVLAMNFVVIRSLAGDRLEWAAPSLEHALAPKGPRLKTNLIPQSDSRRGHKLRAGSGALGPAPVRARDPHKGALAESQFPSLTKLVRLSTRRCGDALRLERFVFPRGLYEAVRGHRPHPKRTQMFERLAGSHGSEETPMGIEGPIRVLEHSSLRISRRPEKPSTAPQPGLAWHLW